MARDRNKPTQSWMERAKFEIEHEEELTIERAYELGKIRGHKEAQERYDKLRILAYNMYTAAQYLTTDASKLKKACDDFYHYINFEENGK